MNSTIIRPNKHEAPAKAAGLLAATALGLAQTAPLAALAPRSALSFLFYKKQSVVMIIP
jgi:hypothetical protein